MFVYMYNKYKYIYIYIYINFFVGSPYVATIGMIQGTICAAMKR